jgi:hypothetical protein
MESQGGEAQRVADKKEKKNRISFGRNLQINIKTSTFQYWILFFLVLC